MMKERIITTESVSAFHNHLIEDEKAASTIEKYLRDVKAFVLYSGSKEITKDTVISYKQSLIDSGYAARSINSMLASLNCLFTS